MASASCPKTRFMLMIDGDTQESGVELWNSIKKYRVNFTQLLDSACVYGEADEYELREIIYQVAKLGLPIKLC